MKKAITRPGKIKKLMALFLAFVLIVGTVPFLATADGLSVTFISDGGLTHSHRNITFTPGNFPATHQVNVGDADVVFYMNVTVTPQGGASDMSGSFGVPSGELPVIPPTDDGIVDDEDADGEVTEDSANDEAAGDEVTENSANDEVTGGEVDEETPADGNGDTEEYTEDNLTDEPQANITTGNANILRSIGTALGLVPVTVFASEYENTANDIILTWYQDGQRRGDMGHTVIPAYALASLTPVDISVELRFDTIWATDGGIWTLRAFYDGSQFVESPYSLDLVVVPFGITPFNTVVDNIADLQTAVGSATPTLPVTVTLANNFTGGGTITVPANSTVTINSNVTINNGTNTLTFHLDGGAGTLTTVIWNADITAPSGNAGTISLTGNGNFIVNGTIRQTHPTSSLALRVNGPDVSISSTGLIQDIGFSGTAITILSGRVTLDGGTVQSAGSPAAIITNTGAEGLVVNSGTILNIAQAGGAISVVSGTATIYGGTITGGLSQSVGTFNMHGGTNVVRRSVELSGALTAIGNGTGTIRLGASFPHGSQIVIPTGANITLTSDTGNRTLTRDFSGGAFISVQSGATLTLEDVVIDGGSTGGLNAGGRLVFVFGTLTMNDGAVLQNSQGGPAGGVNVQNNATFNMTGGTIRDTISDLEGGGVIMSGAATFTMTGGSISGNSAPNNGGGVRRVGGGTLTLGGTATIANNTVGGNPNNVSLSSGLFITLGAGANAPAAGMNVGVNTQTASGVFVNSGATTAHAAFFSADATGMAVVHSGVQLQLAPARTLAINMHGGSGSPAFPTAIPQTAWTIAPTTPIPTRTGFNFGGWALTDSGAAVTSVPAGTTAVTLHALWIPHTNIINLSLTSPPAIGIGWTFDSATNDYIIADGANVTVIGTNAGSQRRLMVEGNATATITLENVTIEGDLLAANHTALWLADGATATVTLVGTNTLAGGADRAGIGVPVGRTLTINGTGSLTAMGGIGGAAGIGGGVGAAAGTITINSGNVTALGGGNGAGIGGGAGATASGNITINGGNVTANRSAIGHANRNSIGAGVDTAGVSGAVGTINIATGAVTVNGPVSGHTSAQLINITTQPANTNVTHGQITQSLSVATTPIIANTLTFQWQQQDGASWNNVGPNSATLAIPTNLAQGNHNFRARVAALGTNPAGIIYVTSNTATVTVGAAGPTDITAAAITQVQTPTTGQARIGTGATATGNFSVSLITWSPTGGTTFIDGRQYTASVTLTANAGHTFQTGFTATINGVDATVNVTNPGTEGNTVTVSRLFAATSLTPIPTTAINVTAPATGAAPSGASTGPGNFTRGPVTWAPGNNPFTGGTQYTASITLTADIGHTFPATFTATINGNAAVVTNTSPDTAANAVTLSWTFAPTTTAPTITPTTVPGGVVGTSYTQNFTATSTTPITWLVPTGTIPPGLTFNMATGTLSGTPTTAGTFTFVVRAENMVGIGTQSITLTINLAATVPSVPQNFVAIPGNGQVSLGWSAPANDGGSPITHFEVQVGTGLWTTVPGEIGATSHTVAGLTNGTPVTIGIRAVNAVGNSTSVAETVTPVTVPGPPLNLTAIAGDAEVTLAWDAPASDGGSAILGYQVSINGAAWQAVTGLGETITGLTNSQSYSFRIRAENAAGFSAYVTETATPIAAHISVTNITGVPTTATVGTPRALSGTIVPSNATNRTISWSIQNPGTTGATISENTLHTTAAGTVVVRATIINGATATTNFTRNFTITVSTPPSGGGTSVRSGGGNQGNLTNAQRPSIPNNQPGDITVHVGEDATLSVIATVTDGGRLSFQWYRATGANGGNFTRIDDATAPTFSPHTATLGVNRYRVVVTNTSGNRTAQATSRIATVTVTEPNLTLPNVNVELSQSLAAELQTLLGDRFTDLKINISTATPNTTNGLVVADISFSIDDAALNNALNNQLPNILQAPATYYTILADLSDAIDNGVNYHRIVALQNGVIIGGGISSQGMIFSVNTNTTGRFTIAYVETLKRLTLSLNSFTITDLAGNTPTQTMDVLPIIQDGRTLLPIRFIAEALGADVDWIPATANTPMTIHITRDGQTLSFAIGEITPQLAALGMDVPAQLINDRTMVPLRFIAEFFGAVVDWDGDDRSIEIVRGDMAQSANHNPPTSDQPSNNPDEATTDHSHMEATEGATSTLDNSEDDEP